MKGIVRLLMAINLWCPLGLHAQGITDVITALDASTGVPYAARATFEVFLPQANDPITYTVDLQQFPNSNTTDTLAPCDYLIDWTLPTDTGPASGFAAYFDGHHYRYRGDRLQEFHSQWDNSSFSPPGLSPKDGVQSTAQFVDLLPAFMSNTLRDFESDSTFTYDYQNGRIKGVQTINGIESREFEYIFDPSSGRPLSFETVSNPGSISEQIVSVHYSPAEASIRPPLTEEILQARYPEIFGKYRSSNFHVENLRGHSLPSFSAPTPSGERYTYNKGAAMAAPTVVAVMDSQTGDPVRVVANLRDALATAPFEMGLVLAFMDNRADAVESVTGPLRQGEAILMSARSLSRDAGVTGYPTFLLVDSAGTIQEVIIGDYPDLTSLIIQKMSIIK